jgi:hypothetical protein
MAKKKVSVTDSVLYTKESAESAKAAAEDLKKPDPSPLRAKAMLDKKNDIEEDEKDGESK